MSKRIIVIIFLFLINLQNCSGDKNAEDYGNIDGYHFEIVFFTGCFQKFPVADFSDF